MYIVVYNIRLGVIRITLDYIELDYSEDSFVFHFAYIEYRIHTSLSKWAETMELLEVKSVEWRIDQAAFLGEEWGRDPKDSQRSRLEVFRSHDCSQCLNGFLMFFDMWLSFLVRSKIWWCVRIMRCSNIQYELSISKEVCRCLIMRRRFVAA